MSDYRQEGLLKVISDSRNWGDMIATNLYHLITGRKPVAIPMDRCATEPHFLTVGSVLRMADSNSIVWGTGFLTPDDGIGGLNWKRQNSEVLHKPLKICAVRGPLTRQKLHDMGFDCPEVFGDPAWLLAKFYRSTAKQKFKLGIVPHFKDRHSEVIREMRRLDGVLIIDPVCSRFSVTTHSKYMRFLNQIQSCEYVASSSLHGLIMADAYGIPARWCITSPTAWESEFKFLDYFASIGRPNVPPLRMDRTMTVAGILKSFHRYTVCDFSEELLGACPFN